MGRHTKGSHNHAGAGKASTLLTNLGWTQTRAGRWVDLLTQRSYTAGEAWSEVYGES